MITSIVSTFLVFVLLSSFTYAAVFTIRNNCRYTVWAGAVPGGGRQLNPGQTRYLSVTAGTTGARICPRTNCKFDGSGRGRCVIATVSYIAKAMANHLTHWPNTL